MECDREGFLSFWTVFCILQPYGPKKSNFEKFKKYTRIYYHFTILKIKILKKLKKTTGEIIILHMSIISCMVPEIWRVMDTFFVILDHFLAFFTPLATWKIKTLKNKKTPGVIIILHKCTKSHDHMLHCSFYIPSPTPGSRQNQRFSGILTKKYVLFPDFYCKKVTFSPESSRKYFFQDSTSQLTS